MDPTFPRRAREAGGGLIVAGENYGQGSSREHAAICPMYLGIKVVLAKSYARIHESNLVNVGIPPLVFVDPADCDSIGQGDRLEAAGVRRALAEGQPIMARNVSRGREYHLSHALSRRQVEMLLAGGLTRYLQRKWEAERRPTSTAR